MFTEGPFEARVSAAVRRQLEIRFGDRVSFDAIMAVPRTDWSGDESVHIYVVYDGNGEPLDAHCLNKNVTEGKQFSQPIGNCAGSHVGGHAVVVGVVCRQSFRMSGPVPREARFVKAMRLAQLVFAGVAPIRYLPVPHTTHHGLDRWPAILHRHRLHVA